MLRTLKALERYTVSATDGDIGTVENFLLDDEHWTIRYLVVDTVKFLDGRHVLISPISFRRAEWSTRRFQVDLTMARIEGCPSADVDQPVSRQHEQDFNQYYGYPSYWASSGIWGMGSTPAMISARRVEDAAERAVALSEKLACDAHLRSTQELRGYHLQGSEGAIGHVADFIIDDETWTVRYLVIDTSNWWFGKQVLIAPPWASRVSWEEKALFVDLSRAAVKTSPEWDAGTAMDRDFEQRLHDHFGRPAYWAKDDHPAATEVSQHH